MKQLAIASLVGTLIVYVTVFLTYMAQLHFSDYKYSPAQDALLNTLSQSLTEDGFYRLPYVPPGLSMAEQHELMESQMGKPVVLVVYNSTSGESGLTLVMAFIYNLISVLIICIALAVASDKLNSFGQRLWFVMLFAFFAIFAVTMMHYNWENYPMHYLKGPIINLVAGYLLTGLWLAWYYGRIAVKNRQKAQAA